MRVTGHPASAYPTLEGYEATCTDAIVESDGLIITTQNASVSEALALAILEAL